MTYPDPPIAQDTDICGLDGFMLNTERLLASELWAISTGDEFKAAMGLWCRAWKQTPPGSLPDDDRVLAAFSGAGARWAKLRDVALRGFFKCSDGRLYHRVLCEDVARAAKKKAERRERTRAATEARVRERNELRNVQRDVSVTTSHRQGQGQGQRKKEEKQDDSAARLTTRGTRMQPEAKITDDDRLFARQHGLSEAEIDKAWVEFVDYWIAVPGQRGSKLDWPATWRNRVREVFSRRKPKGNGHADDRSIGAVARAAAERYRTLAESDGVCDDDGVPPYRLLPQRTGT